MLQSQASKQPSAAHHQHRSPSPEFPPPSPTLSSLNNQTITMSAFRPTTRPLFRNPQFLFRRPTAGRPRFQSSTTGTAAGEGASGNAPQEPWLKRMWNSPIGLKTVHFW